MNQDEFNQWKHSPATKYFLDYLGYKHQQIIETWEAGGYTSEDIHNSDRLNSEAVTKAKVIREILTLEYDDMEGFDRE